MPRSAADQPSVVTGVTDALPVSAAATTSRSLIDNDQVRVVAFAFDTGEELTEHTAAMPVVVQIIDGTVRFDVAGESHQLVPGDCVYLPARQPHSLQAVEPARLTLTMIRAE